MCFRCAGVQNSNPEGKLTFFFLKHCSQARASPLPWLLDDIWTAEALVRLLRLSFTCFEKCYRISNTHLKPNFQITPLNIMKKNIFMAPYKIVDITLSPGAAGVKKRNL